MPQSRWRCWCMAKTADLSLLENS